MATKKKKITEKFENIETLAERLEKAVEAFGEQIVACDDPNELCALVNVLDNSSLPYGSIENFKNEISTQIENILESLDIDAYPAGDAISIAINNENFIASLINAHAHGVDLTCFGDTITYIPDPDGELIAVEMASFKHNYSRKRIELTDLTKELDLREQFDFNDQPIFPECNCSCPKHCPKN